MTNHYFAAEQINIGDEVYFCGISEQPEEVFDIYYPEHAEDRIVFICETNAYNVHEKDIYYVEYRAPMS